MKYLVIAEEQGHFYDFVLGIFESKEDAEHYIVEIKPHIDRYCYGYVEIQEYPGRPLTGIEAAELLRESCHR